MGCDECDGLKKMLTDIGYMNEIMTLKSAVMWILMDYEELLNEQDTDVDIEFTDDDLDDKGELD